MKDIIQSNFTVDQRVKIMAGDYFGKEGVVMRLGAAASVVYVHVLIDGFLTVLTFTENQIK